MRDFAQIKLSIWNDDAFLDLSNNAQLLYFVLISHPTMNRAGVGTWHAGRLSGMCSTWTRQDVERAACELIDGRFIVVDEDTDEFLVRTFVRHDGLMKQRNLATTMAREFAAVGSRAIKGVVVWELRRLHEEHPEFKGWGSDEALALLKKRAIDPSIDPRVKGEPKGSVDPSVDPSPTTATTTTTFSRRSQRGETRDGVEGVRGRRGNQTTADDTTESDASNPPPESLDELAAAYAARTRCPKHRHIPDGEWVDEPCRECQKLREGAEAQDAEAAEAEKEARRRAIDACDLCDDNGMRYEAGEAWRCDHNPETGSNRGPDATQTDEQPARAQITPNRHQKASEGKAGTILSRNRNSAKQAGARFERQIADYLAANLDDRIDRRVKTGAKDCGDIANVRDSHNRRIVIEAKDYGGRLNPAQWLKEAQTEAANDNAYAGIVIAKRKGTTNPADQYVLTDLATLTRLLKGPGQ